MTSSLRRENSLDEDCGGAGSGLPVQRVIGKGAVGGEQKEKGRAAKGRAGQGRTGQSRARQGTAGQGRSSAVGRPGV